MPIIGGSTIDSTFPTYCIYMYMYIYSYCTVTVGYTSLMTYAIHSIHSVAECIIKRDLSSTHICAVGVSRLVEDVDCVEELHG